MYAYKYYQSTDGGGNLLVADFSPVQILETCMLPGNGATVMYLELSFLSECVEKLPTFVDSGRLANQTNITSEGFHFDNYVSF